MFFSNTLPSILVGEAERNPFVVADIHRSVVAGTLLAEDTEAVACYMPVAAAGHSQAEDSAHSHTLVVEVGRLPVVVGDICPAAGRTQQGYRIDLVVERHTALEEVLHIVLHIVLVVVLHNLGHQQAENFLHLECRMSYRLLRA